MTRPSTYLDHNASAPLLPEAREAVIAALDLVGNPSSVHRHGRELLGLIEAARDQVAGLAGAERRQVVFTGSATEAIAQAILGGVKALGVDALVTSAGEHAAVTRSAAAAAVPVFPLGLDGNGVVRIAELSDRLEAAEASGEVLLVAVQAVNNETGVVQPVRQIEMLVGPTRHLLFIDAVQAFGKLPLEFAVRAPDMMAVSAHKIGGPVGVGALLLKGHADGVRLIEGGGQELGRRAGTQSAALIAGFGAAAEAFAGRYEAAGDGELLQRFESGLRTIAPDAIIFGEAAERVGNVASFAVPGIKGSVAMIALDLAGVSVSSGSACASGKVGRSHVLGAMGVAPELAEGALRVSFGWNSTAQDVEAFLAAFEKIVAPARAKYVSAA